MFCQVHEIPAPFGSIMWSLPLIFPFNQVVQHKIVLLRPWFKAFSSLFSIYFQFNYGIYLRKIYLGTGQRPCHENLSCFQIMEVTFAIQFASEQNYYWKLFTEKVQITPLKYDQSLYNPLKYFLVWFTLATMSIGPIFPLTRFFLFFCFSIHLNFNLKFCRLIGTS